MTCSTCTSKVSSAHAIRITTIEVLYGSADDVFLTAVFQHCNEVAVPSEVAAKFRKELLSLRSSAREWEKVCRLVRPFDFE